MHPLVLLDGPMGTELLARGVPTPLPGWSAHALETAPEVVSEIHREYARAGADVHTTNTFRTQPRVFPTTWRKLVRHAVTAARRGVSGFEARIAGSMAPLEDCYTPSASPENPRPEHRAIARTLAEAGVDLLLVETFPHIGEALVAVEEAVETGLPTWVSFTAGPDGNLLTPDQVRTAADQAIALGAGAVLVNCVPTRQVERFLRPLRGLAVPFGGYGNAGSAHDEVGFLSDPISATDYAAAANTWIDIGASLIGGCCGTGVDHIRALRDGLTDSQS